MADKARCGATHDTLQDTRSAQTAMLHSGCPYGAATGVSSMCRRCRGATHSRPRLHRTLRRRRSNKLRTSSQRAAIAQVRHPRQGQCGPRSQLLGSDQLRLQTQLDTANCAAHAGRSLGLITSTALLAGELARCRAWLGECRGTGSDDHASRSGDNQNVWINILQSNQWYLGGVNANNGGPHFPRPAHSSSTDSDPTGRNSPEPNGHKKNLHGTSFRAARHQVNAIADPAGTDGVLTTKCMVTPTKTALAMPIPVLFR